MSKPAGFANLAVALARRIDPQAQEITPGEAFENMHMFVDGIENHLDEMMRLIDYVFPTGGSLDERVNDVFAAVLARMVELYADKMPPTPWQDVSVADRGLIRAAMRAGAIGFDDRGSLRRIAPGDAPPWPQGTPFFVFGLMLKAQGKLHPVFDIPNLFASVVTRDGKTENAQQAILAVLWNARTPITTDDLAARSGVPVAELAAPLALFAQHEIVRRVADGRWIFVRCMMPVAAILSEAGYTFSAGASPTTLHMLQHGTDRGEWTADAIREAGGILRRKGRRAGVAFDLLANLLDANDSLRVLEQLDEMTVAIDVNEWKAA